MVMFYSYVNVYQRVYRFPNPQFWWKALGSRAIASAVNHTWRSVWIPTTVFFFGDKSTVAAMDVSMNYGAFQFNISIPGTWRWSDPWEVALCGGFNFFDLFYPIQTAYLSVGFLSSGEYCYLAGAAVSFPAVQHNKTPLQTWGHSHLHGTFPQFSALLDLQCLAQTLRYWIKGFQETRAVWLTTSLQLTLILRYWYYTFRKEWKTKNAMVNPAGFWRFLPWAYQFRSCVTNHLQGQANHHPMNHWG